MLSGVAGIGDMNCLQGDGSTLRFERQLEHLDIAQAVFTEHFG
jgi:hypothetical protein